MSEQAQHTTTLFEALGGRLIRRIAEAEVNNVDCPTDIELRLVGIIRERDNLKQENAELLEALEAAVEFMHEQMIGPVDRCEAALAKAKGQQ